MSSIPDLIMFIVYREPEFDGKFVLRCCLVEDGEPLSLEPPVAIADTLEEARKPIPEDFTNLGTAEMDNPAIVEVWF
jgi:hypothetical protein